MSEEIITLKAAKRLREGSRGVTDKHMAKLTGIDHRRIVKLESLNAHVAEEPWLTEAKAIADVLQVPFMELIGQSDGRLEDIDTGYDLQDELDVWRTGVPLPLRFAIKLAVRFELDSPFDLLDIRPVYQRIWSTLEYGERLGAPGICPYCSAALVGSVGHFPSCVPSMLFGRRNAHMVTIGTAPKPRKPHKARGGSKPALGLKALRDRLGLTQEAMAASIGIAGTTYYRIEKLHDKLTIDKAEKIAALYKVGLDVLYQPPMLSGDLT